eukprot:scaffold1518_cov331-Pavlova_lutheri.AAC.22
MADSRCGALFLFRRTQDRRVAPSRIGPFGFPSKRAFASGDDLPDVKGLRASDRSELDSRTKGRREGQRIHRRDGRAAFCALARSFASVE